MSLPQEGVGFGLLRLILEQCSKRLHCLSSSSMLKCNPSFQHEGVGSAGVVTQDLMELLGRGVLLPCGPIKGG